MIFGTVLTFYFLDKSRRIDTSFILSLPSAILASYSFVTGLLVWPVGIIQLLITDGKKDLKKLILWGLFAVITYTSYFYDFFAPPSFVKFHATSLMTAGRYILVLIGAPLSDGVANSTGFGLVTTITGIFIIIFQHKMKLYIKDRIWISLVIVISLSLIAISFGRSGFGISQALSSRYTPITLLGISSLYLLAISIFHNSSTKNKSLAAHFLLALILVGVVVSYSTGWDEGYKSKHRNETALYILKTYKIQSNESIRRYICPDVDWVRGLIKFSEKNKLHIFSDPAIETSKLIMINQSTLFAIESINDRTTYGKNPIIINSNTEKTIYIEGWAVDKQFNNTASAVLLTLDEELDIPTIYGLDRSDISDQLNTPNFRFSGFKASLSSSILDEGTHTLILKIVTKDGNNYYYPQQKLIFTIVRDEK